MEGRQCTKSQVDGPKKRASGRKSRNLKSKLKRKSKSLVKEKEKSKKKLPRAFVEGARNVPKPRRIPKPKRAHLRKGLVPGAILIILSGPHRGKRVVFLKQLPSGLLLITGPYVVNGVPVRRVNQAYVIATTTRIGINFKIPKTFDDKYFRKPREKKKKAKPEDAFEKKKPEGIPAQRKEDQKKLDKLLLPLIKKTPLLKYYLKAPFTLTKQTLPHLMKF